MGIFLTIADTEMLCPEFSPGGCVSSEFLEVLDADRLHQELLLCRGNCGHKDCAPMQCQRTLLTAGFL